MAKQPTWYPNLPRDPRHPKGPRTNALHVTQAVKVPFVRKADWFYKPTSSLIDANLINVNQMSNLGNETHSGVKVPGWKVKVAQGSDATSDYSRTHWSIIPTKHKILSESAQYLSKGYGTSYGGLLVLERDTTDLDDQAVARLKRKLANNIGNAELGPPLAESKEIGRLVRQINKLAYDTLKALLDARKSRGRSIAKQAGAIWLGYGFGVNPLLSDIKTLCDSILHYVSRTDRRLVISASATREYTSGFRDTSSSDAIAYSAMLGFSQNAVHKQGIRYVAGLDVKVKSGASYSIADHLGLKLGALPATAWELTAFSWVVDYFTTVGPWLDDMFYTVPASTVYCQKNYKYQSKTTSYPFVFPFPGFVFSLTANASIVKYTYFSRTKLTSLPSRSLRVKSVDEIAKHGLQKLLNLGSVLAGGPYWHYGP